MKAVVTGGAGFIGSHLVDALLVDGHSVHVIDNLVNGRLENLVQHQDNPKLTVQQTDIRDKAAIKSGFDGADWVFHLAGLADIVPSIDQPDDYITTNVNGTLNVLECAREADVSRLIYAASSSCYGIPDSYPTPETAAICPQYPYALSKHMGEELVLHWQQCYGLSTTALRLFNVYGPRSRTTGAYGAVFGVFLAQKLGGQPYTVVGDGNQSRDFTYVTDVASAFVAAAQAELAGEVFNIGSGDHYSINQLVALLGGSKTHLPKRPGEPDCTFADISKIQQQLGWSPSITFEQGVEQMLNHIDDWQSAPLRNSDSIAEATKSWFHFLEDSDE